MIRNKLILIFCLTLVGCSKDWSCTVTNNGNQADPVYFHGTSEEKDEYEQQNTWTATIWGETVESEMNCLPD